MNEDPTAAAWFYTRDGERIGPVALADLRTLAESGELNPRLDMCWTQGMDEWKPAGEIDGLFKKSGNPASSGQDASPPGGKRADAAANMS